MFKNAKCTILFGSKASRVLTRLVDRKDFTGLYIPNILSSNEVKCTCFGSNDNNAFRKKYS